MRRRSIKKQNVCSTKMAMLTEKTVNSFFRRLHQVELTPAFLLMLCKPPVRRLRRSIDSTLHIAKIRGFVPTAAITAPPPFSAIIDFIVERMVHGDMRFRGLVDAIHVFLKLFSMIVSIKIIVRYKQVGVDHFVLHINSLRHSYKQRVHCIRPLPKREQRLRQAD